MKPKAKCKIAIDLLMTLGLLFLMGYPLWDDAAHEWVGAGMFALFIVHHLLNGSGYRGLFRARPAPARMFQIAVDLLVFLDMIGLMVSGVMLSNHVFAFLDIRGGLAFARLLHMAASYWGFALMALHLGMHWSVFVAIARRALGRRQPTRMGKRLWTAAGAGIAAYGLCAFARRDWLTYMLVRTHFVFLDFGEPIPLFYLDCLAMMGTFIFLGHGVNRLLQRAAGNRKPVQ